MLLSWWLNVSGLSCGAVGALVGTTAVVLCMSNTAYSDQPLAQTASTKQEQTQPANGAEKPAGQQRGTESNPLIIKTLPAQATKEESDYQQYEHFERPKIERIGAIAAIALAGITLGLAIFTALLYWWTRRLARDAVAAAARQAQEMQQSLTVARESAAAASKAAEASMLAIRPWVPAEISLKSGLTWDESGARVSIGIMLRNTGNSPAMNVAVHLNVYPRTGGSPDPVEEQKRMAETMTIRPRPPNASGVTIFPGENYQVIMSQPITREDIAKGVAWMTQQHGPGEYQSYFVLAVVGFIAYRSLHDDHQTGFIYDLGKVSSHNAFDLTAFNESDGNLGVGSLRLNRANSSGITD